MKRVLKNPAINAVGISLFTAFYAIIFIMTSGDVEFANLLYYSRETSLHPFWSGWSSFLASGHGPEESISFI